MSYDVNSAEVAIKGGLSQSLWNRAMSYDSEHRITLNWFNLSQSLWNRAMSYDNVEVEGRIGSQVSIPLEQGNVLRRF